MSQSTVGINYLFDGMQLMFKPGLRRFVFIPLLLNIMLFMGLGWYVIHQFGTLLLFIDSFLPGWLLWLHWLLWPLFIITTLLIFLYCFTFIATLIASPFNGLLSERVEYYLTGKALPDLNWKTLIADLPRILWRECQKFLYYLPRAIGIGILFFIPVVQVIAPFLWFLFSAWALAMLYIDYPMDNHRIPFLQMRSEMQRSRIVVSGFGIMVMIFTFIPIINLLIMPAAVAGATQSWVDEYRERLVAQT